MKRTLLLAMVAACQASNGDDFSVEPGGPGGTGMRVDASLIDAFDPDALPVISGRVCLVRDLRAPTAGCAGSGADNITVTLGSRTAVTSADGSFSIMKPAGSNLVWRASRPGIIVTSVVPFGPDTTIPAIGVQDYLDLQGANSVVIVAGQGSIVTRIERNNTAQPGVTAAVSPTAAFATKYDGTTALAWTELATSTRGTVWLPGTELGTNTVTATPATGAPTTLNVLVEDQSITYVTIDLP